MNSKTGVLTLIPTPISEEVNIDSYAFEALKAASLDLGNNKIYVEDLKPARRSWIRWGLDRDVIDHFVLFNEHSMAGLLNKTIEQLNSGKNVFLMSDGGLPAFCDPGANLVRSAHQKGIKVTSTPFSNSISLAIALSGIDVREFHFYGFPPKKTEERAVFFNKLCNTNSASVIMDTPYRLKKVLSELQSAGIKRDIFLACDLCTSHERLYFGKINSIIKRLQVDKAEFIIVIE